jgi:hypothetical protein
MRTPKKVKITEKHAQPNENSLSLIFRFHASADAEPKPSSILLIHDCPHNRFRRQYRPSRSTASFGVAEVLARILFNVLGEENLRSFMSGIAPNA